MIDKYPTFSRYELPRIFERLPWQEQKLIEDFIAYCGITAGPGKQEDIKRNLIQFRHIIQKNFGEISLTDLRHFLILLNHSDRKEYTRNGIKAHIRRFLRWHFKDWSQRFDEFQDIKLRNAFNEEKINEGTLLKKEQIELIVKRERDFVRRAFFVILYESGMRPQELTQLRWKNVRIDVGQGLSQIHIFATKTARARTVFVKEATSYLRKLFDNRASEYVFPAHEDANTPLPKSTSFRWVQEMGKAVGLNIFPYLLRHTRAHELYSRMPAKVAQKFMGHGSDMSNLYAHISSKDIKESMLKTVYNFEEISEERKTALELEVEKLRKEVDTIREHFPLISRIVTAGPSSEKIAAKIRTRNR